MAAGGAQASSAGGDGGQGMEDVCAGLLMQRKESNICPISNARLGSSGTELLVRRKLTFSCVYELNLWFTLGLIFSPLLTPVIECNTPFSKEITFSSFSPLLGFFFFKCCSR